MDEESHDAINDEDEKDVRPDVFVDDAGDRHDPRKLCRTSPHLVTL